MKTLVIGAAGGFGGTVARELESRGHAVRVLLRPGGRVPRLARATSVTGDARDARALTEAASGVDAIVWGFHLPYSKWQPGAIDALRATASAAARRGCTVLFPGNVYGLGSGLRGPADESAPLASQTPLGRVRNELEALLEAATRDGARAIVLRAGDYLGPDAAHSWFEMMSARAVRGGALIEPGPAGVPHAWAYLPDVARAGVDLLERRAALAPYEVFHFAGYELDAPALCEVIRGVLGDPLRPAWRMPWWLMRAASPFSAELRHVLEMRYLWDEPVLLNGAKLSRTLPAFRATPLEEAVSRTLEAIAQRRGIARPLHALSSRVAA